MKLTYLGTSGGGGVPEMFCSCRVCEGARRLKGRDIRTRSQAIIDDIISIDCPVDTFLHTLHSGLDMRKIKHFLVTHNHYDHFMHQNFSGRPQGVVEPCRIYLSKGSSGPLISANAQKIESERIGKKVRTSDFALEIHIIKPFEPFEISGYKITPLEARHVENVEPLIYLLQHGGKSILWAHDTGLLPDSTMDYLRRLRLNLDFISLDCTLGRGQLITAAHMDFNQCLETVAELERAGLVIRNKTRIFLSHLSHLSGLTHQEQIDEAREYGIEVAYDGLTITIGDI